MFQTINDPSPLSAAPLKKKRGRPRKIKVEEEDESFAEPLVTFKVKDKEDIRNHFCCVAAPGCLSRILIFINPGFRIQQQHEKRGRIVLSYHFS
jgi:hypothetical protein